MNSNLEKYGGIFAAIMGIAALGFGIMEIFLRGEWGPLTTDGGTFTPWRGIILIFAGVLFLSSVARFMDVRQVAKGVMGSIMIWVLAAMDIWAMIAASIPSGAEDAGEPWFASGADFLGAYGSPYMPAMYLLIPSLVIIYFILRRRTAS